MKSQIHAQHEVRNVAAILNRKPASVPTSPVEIPAGFVSVTDFMSSPAEPLLIAGRQFSSRLLIGTGKFPSNETMAEALSASGTQLVTVALRRADLSGKGDAFANILEFVDRKKYLLLPNTSGAINAEEAVR